MGGPEYHWPVTVILRSPDDWKRWIANLRLRYGSVWKYIDPEVTPEKREAFPEKPKTMSLREFAARLEKKQDPEDLSTESSDSEDDPNDIWNLDLNIEVLKMYNSRLTIHEYEIQRWYQLDDEMREVMVHISETVDPDHQLLLEHLKTAREMVLRLQQLLKPPEYAIGAEALGLYMAQTYARDTNQNSLARANKSEQAYNRAVNQKRAEGHTGSGASRFRQRRKASP